MKSIGKVVSAMLFAAALLLAAAMPAMAASKGGPGYNGWNQLEDGSYTYISKGRTLCSDWVLDGESWFYMNENGVMVTGWQTINDEKYYFAEQKTDTHPYGSCYINEKTPDGQSVDERGVLINRVVVGGVDYERVNPYGVTCVEVDLTNQAVYAYQGMTLVAAGPCVTGRAGAHDTPPGNFTVKSKETNRVLRGTNDNGTKYASHVDFWMPFNGGIGLHNAGWRSEFGGTIYRRSGSHGCVNLPYDLAAAIYNMCYVGMPVYVHH